MDWGTFGSKLSDGAKIGLNQALKRGSPGNVKAGMRNVAKQAEKAAKKYEPKKGLFPFFK